MSGVTALIVTAIALIIVGAVSSFLVKEEGLSDGE